LIREKNNKNSVMMVCCKELWMVTTTIMMTLLLLSIPMVHSSMPHEQNTLASRQTTDAVVREALDLLISMGVPGENLCTATSDSEAASFPSTNLAVLPRCLEALDEFDKFEPKAASFTTTRWVRSRRERYLLETPSSGEDEEEEDHDQWFYITHAACALACVVTAALAAGLTMGLLSLDPLLLLIKVRAGATQKERDEAASLLPIVKQHHLLLVTLLLLNSLANEALPLFLEVLVSPVVAVVLSVTLVLFFGEIIPSAIFTGPNKIEIAARMVPLVKLVMGLLWPLAFPIAKLLDHVLHSDDADSGDMFGRGELSALVRIQYEERMAHKKRQKEEKAALSSMLTNTTGSDVVDNNVGALDFASTQAIKASKRTVERLNSQPVIEASTHPQSSRRTSTTSDDKDPLLTPTTAVRSMSIHVDEVSMVEGALSMKTKMALDVYTPLHRMLSIPYDMLLNERNMVAIYSRGFSRIPVFMPNPDKPKSVTAICGVLMTKQLIVVNPKDQRPLSTLPLACPRCVSPKRNLVDLLNLFQTGRAGHLALVCARPQKGQDALDQGNALPEDAGLMGYVINSGFRCFC
jgi:metal transporter CNNM